MLSAVLAEAQNLGGNRFMFLDGADPRAGSRCSRSTCWRTRLLQHPVAALGATATLALLMPQISFSRDSTTEIPIQVLLFTALWLLCDRRTLRTPRPGLQRRAPPRSRAGDARRRPRVPRRPARGLRDHVAAHEPRPAASDLKRGILWSARRASVVGLLLGAFDLVRWDRYYLSVVAQERRAARRRRDRSRSRAAFGVVAARAAHRTSSQRSSGSRPAAAYVGGRARADRRIRRVVRAAAASSTCTPDPNEMVGFVQRLNHLHDRSARSATPSSRCGGSAGTSGRSR